MPKSERFNKTPVTENKHSPITFPWMLTTLPLKQTASTMKYDEWGFTKQQVHLPSILKNRVKINRNIQEITKTIIKPTLCCCSYSSVSLSTVSTVISPSVSFLWEKLVWWLNFTTKIIRPQARYTAKEQIWMSTFHCLQGAIYLYV